MKKEIVIGGLAGLLLVVVTGGVGLYFWLQPNQDSKDSTEMVVANDKLMTFIPLEKFVVSVKDDSDILHYVLIEMSLVTKKPAIEEKIKEYSPVIRNSLVQLYSGQSHQQMLEYTRKITDMQNEILQKINTTIASYGIDPDIDNVLITKFVIQ
jgi:flagellar protein FliL